MSGPVFHITPLGCLGNRMFQYMVALKLTGMVPGCRISNVDSPPGASDTIRFPRPDRFTASSAGNTST